MTKRGTGNKKTRTNYIRRRKEQRVPPDLKAWLRSLYQRGILGVLLVSLSIVTLLGLIPGGGSQDTSGVVINWWSNLLLRALGWASYAVVLAGVGVGCLLLAGRMPSRERIPWHVAIGVEIVFLALIGLTHLLFAGADSWGAAEVGRGGGYVGAVFSGILRELLGPLPTGLILGVILAWGVITASGLTFEEWVERLESWVYQARQWVSDALTDLAARRPFADAAHADVARADVTHADVGLLHPAGVELPAESSGAESQGSAPRSVWAVAWGGEARNPVPSHGRSPTSVAAPRSVGATLRGTAASERARRPRIVLPPLELLEEPDEALFDEADIREKAKIIEETLDHFGVPAKVVEINWGPRVTQFGVEPGYVIRRGHNGEETERKIRVAKIASLSNDLALALAAAPVRIEAPVPGRSMVGIEVPNSQVSIVSLRRVMSSKMFRRLRSNLRLALGEGVAGAPLVADLARMPHLLIAGATGSGKSVCINTMATCLLFQNSPFTLRLVMIDPKRVELSRYNGVPHLYGRVESDVERIVSVLRWLVRVMEERYKKLAQAGVRHLDEYNRYWRVGSSEYMPRIVVLIDELADMMFFSPDEVEHSVIRLAQMARATGMHLVIATQRPSVDVVTGLIKANFPARIGFAVSSGVDSRVILDAVGAETLLSKGDMLYMAPDASGLLRAQGCSVSDVEVERVIHYWQEWATAEGWEADSRSGICPWEYLLDQQDEEGVDDLLQQAVEIVRQQGSASASLLQRRMHIGYPRASRLIDEMEELGIVGPAESGGRPRQVLDTAYEVGTADAAQTERGGYMEQGVRSKE